MGPWLVAFYSGLYERLILHNCMGIVIISQYKDPVINQSVFHGSCHVRVLNPQVRAKQLEF